jgi:two-component system chemotaxis response regulator CheY
MARVLLIDDDELIRGSLKLHLETRGHTVVLARHGGEGLAAFRSDTFDLVITDILMPDVEGIETIVGLRRVTADVPIIAISGGWSGIEGETYLEMAERLGATTILRKPFTARDFLATVEACLTRTG